MQKNTIPKEKAMPKNYNPSKYLVNEIFYSIQGEGAYAGTSMVFVRFSRCNLRCSVRNAGFDCDTDFQAYRELTLNDLIDNIRQAATLHPPDFPLLVLLTGGEPGLQITEELLDALEESKMIAHVETNGTVQLPKHEALGWIACSPKSAEHTIRQRVVDEVRLVRAHGQAIPQISDLPFFSRPYTSVRYFLSPAFQADGSLRRKDLDWCLEAVLRNPDWSLSLQLHKFIGAR